MSDAEIDTLVVIANTLEPLSPEARCRVLATVAAHFGYYDLAIDVLERAGVIAAIAARVGEP